MGRTNQSRSRREIQGNTLFMLATGHVLHSTRAVVACRSPLRCRFPHEQHNRDFILVISKTEVIARHLRDRRVLDIGGAGYGEDNAYERSLREAWKLCTSRVTADDSPQADIRVDLNAIPLPPLSHDFDVAVAFDVLEHLENPAAVLRWIPCDRLIVTVPNALSWIARRMERYNKSKHLYSFVPYTATILMGEGGWAVDAVQYQFGKWSLAARMINACGSCCPAFIATGLVLHCSRKKGASVDWQLK
jgi:hypothetical protein